MYENFYQAACFYGAILSLVSALCLRLGWVRPGDLVGYSARSQLIFGLGLAFMPAGVYFDAINQTVLMWVCFVMYHWLFWRGLGEMGKAREAWLSGSAQVMGTPSSDDLE